MKTVLILILCFWTSFAFADGARLPTPVEIANDDAILCCMLTLLCLLFSGFLLLIQRKSKGPKKIPHWLAYVFFVLLTQLFINISLFLIHFAEIFFTERHVGGFISPFFLLALFFISSIILFRILKRKWPQKKWTRWILPVFHFFISLVLFILNFQIFNFDWMSF